MFSSNFPHYHKTKEKNIFTKKVLCEKLFFIHYREKTYILTHTAKMKNIAQKVFFVCRTNENIAQKLFCIMVLLSALKDLKN
jgi:hypothetical protein